MGKLWSFLKNNFLKIGIAFLLVFIPLYPKLPSVSIAHTWVYIRLEDFFILLIVALWLLQLFLKKVKLPPKIWLPFVFYWGVGALSLIISIIFIGPRLANFFPSIAVLYYIRHIEYLSLFFVAFSTIKSKEDLRDYLIILSVAIFGFLIYAFGQHFYLDLWHAFPKFFENFSYCFPSFQTGNEEFAKGIPLCLPEGARTTSTFAGHYDLAAYLVLVIPIFAAVLFSVKRKFHQIMLSILTLMSIMVLIFTASRVSFIAYLFGLTMMLILYNRKKFIIPFYVLSIVLLLIFSSSTAKRFLETFRLSSVVTNNQGQVVGELPSELKNKISKNIIENIPTQNLPAGSGYFGLPQLNAPQRTNEAAVKSTLSIAEAKRLKLENGGVEISTISGTFLIKKVLVYDISFTTRFQAEWPNAWNAMLRNPLLGSGFATVTLAADNNFLRILGETGLLGMATFLSIFFILAFVLKQVLSSVTDNLSKAYMLGIAGGVLGLFFNAVLIDVFEASKVAETLWIMLGIAVGTAFLYKKEFEYKKHITKILTSHFFAGFYLLFISLVFFLRSVGNFFVADDFTWLKWSATTNLRDLPKLFIDSQGFFFRPIDKLVMFFLYTLFSFSPPGYHLFILFIHFLIGLGLYIFVQRLFNNKLLSFIGAFVFLFLPSQAENVFWISTISNSLYALFTVYGLLLWMNFRKSNSKRSYAFSFVFAILAFLSYEGAVVILPLLILFDLFIAKVKIISSKTIISYTPFVLITALYPVVRNLTHTVAIGGDYAYSATHFIPNVIGNFLGYFGLFIVGEPFLALYTQARSVLRGDFLHIAVFLFFAVIALIAILFVNRKRLEKSYKSETLRLVIFSVSFSFISLIPFLGLGNIAQRYGYLASFGFAFLVVVIFNKIIGFVKNKDYKIYLLVFVTVILGTWYYYQNGLVNSEWKETGRITNRTLAYLRLYYDGKHPNSNFYFINVPIRKAEAWIFPVGLSDGVWFIYRDDSISVYKITSIDEGRMLAKQANNFVFAFDKNGNIYAVK
ncbi:MAG: O-antigen ligase family protein [Patescibacteria group bacterium]|nr:O-antigen ligase family protein [Patescibacteria group bacterium]